METYNERIRSFTDSTGARIMLDTWPEVGALAVIAFFVLGLVAISAWYLK